MFFIFIHIKSGSAFSCIFTLVTACLKKCKMYWQNEYKLSAVCNSFYSHPAPIYHVCSIKLALLLF